ncbi:MAG: drug resistance transporter, EmrB/QacA subfamily [Patescibacteria group bacterium]|nr:drug resistance transporter, EmrB/QacA subfamily [Patescibacteria group bacterium]
MSTEPVLSARQHSNAMTGRTRNIAMFVVALAFVMDLLDSTIVNIAIPSIQANLGASYTTIQWLVAGYSLAFALLLITGGRMGDVFGYRKIFIIGVAGFTIASLLSGLAWTPGILIAARLLQGAMAALMVPQVMSLMQVMYPPHERGMINGMFGAMAGVAASLGPVVGGVLIHANIFGLDWRPIFLINVPVGLIGLWAARKYLPAGKSAHPLKLDLIGTGLVMVALSLIVFPLIQGRELDWPVWTFAMMVASLPVFGIFAWWQRRKQALDGSPLVLPALFAKKSFSLGLFTNVVFQGAMVGFFLLSTLLLQIGLGYGVIKAALTGIPTAIGIASTFALLAPKVIPMLGRYAISVGTVVMSVGLSLIAWAVHNGGVHTSPWLLAVPLLVVGVGMGLVMSPIFAVVLNDVDHNHAGSASGILNAVQQVGGAIGIAAIGVVFFGQLTSYAGQSVDQVAPALRDKMTAQHVPAPAQTAIIDGFKVCYHDRVSQKDSTATPESCKQPTAVNPTLGKIVADSAKDANGVNFAHAFKIGALYMTGLLGIVFLLSFALPRHIRPEAFEEAA